MSCRTHREAGANANDGNGDVFSKGLGGPQGAPDGQSDCEGMGNVGFPSRSTGQSFVTLGTNNVFPGAQTTVLISKSDSGCSALESTSPVLQCLQPMRPGHSFEPLLKDWLAPGLADASSERKNAKPVRRGSRAKYFEHRHDTNKLSYVANNVVSF